MPALTDADKKSFIDKIIGTLNDPATKARLIAKEWDPTQRALNLENGVKTVTGDEGILSNLEAATTAAVSTRRSDLDHNYELASQTLGSIEGALGKDDALVHDLRQFRGGLSQTPAKPAPGANK